MSPNAIKCPFVTCAFHGNLLISKDTYPAITYTTCLKPTQALLRHIAQPIGHNCVQTGQNHMYGSSKRSSIKGRAERQFEQSLCENDLPCTTRVCSTVPGSSGTCYWLSSKESSLGEPTRMHQNIRGKSGWQRWGSLGLRHRNSPNHPCTLRIRSTLYRALILPSFVDRLVAVLRVLILNQGSPKPHSFEVRCRM